MSEEAPSQAPAESAGTLLRRAREAAGLHIASLAVSLKVPVRKLEALEEDRYDLLPDLVFVRGLASSVCRTLKIDPRPILDRLPQTTKPRLVHEADGINAPFRAPGDGPKPRWTDQLSRPVALTVAAILLAALVVVFLPVAREVAPVAGLSRSEPARTEPVMPPGTPTTVTSAPAEPRVPVVEPVTPSAAPRSVTAPASSPAVALAASPTLANAPAAAPTATPATAAAPATSASAPATVATAPAAPLPGGVVAFRTRASSWVHVTDSAGTTVLRRLMGPGESATASGALPLSVTVGSAEATEVQVRGKPFNLAPVSRDNVARFEVK